MVAYIIFVFLTLWFSYRIEDSEKAIYHDTKEKAEQGNAHEQCDLGVMYQNGRGVKQDYEKAVYWYTQSAEQGNAHAQYHLGVMYQNGRGVKQDYEKAVYWYTQSAEQGNAYAQYHLGVMYQNGRGIKQDYKKAIYWYEKASEQGNTDAKENLETLRKIYEQEKRNTSSKQKKRNTSSKLKDLPKYIQEAYAIFELTEPLSAKDLKSHYNKLAKKYHPDMNENQSSDEKMKEINIAHDTIQKYIKSKN